MTIPSECRIASINPDHAMILPLTRTPTRMEFSERTRFGNVINKDEVFGTHKVMGQFE
jgi:hypothetical protein